jgi:hypothetical protein
MFQSNDESEDTALQFKTPPTGTTQLALEHLNRELQTLKQVVHKNEEKVTMDVTGIKEQINSHEERLSQTENRVSSLEATVEEEHTLNVAAFADQIERQDFSSNQAKSHCVLITGDKMETENYCTL